jgi:hypothetical protein
MDHPQPEGNIGDKGTLEDQRFIAIAQIKFEVCPFSSELPTLGSNFP